MNSKLVFVVLSVLLLLSACAKPAEKPAAKPEGQPAEPATAPQPSAEDTTASDIESSSAEVDAISNDLNTTAIDDIDKDLAEIDNLDLG